ncbi:MAG: 30S ribosomal protein S17 [Candidatus Pacearchaeota archaeon]|nr:MAG: 30S ribosomal protein S17 [Candidatus Pacearchaeota archaeon]
MKEKKKKEEGRKKDSAKCDDKKCPIHGQLSIRGKYFKGSVKKIVGQRAVIEFKRLIYVKKYERFSKASTKLHAYLPKCLIEKINVGDRVKIGECRPLNKIMHFAVIEKIKEK